MRKVLALIALMTALCVGRLRAARSEGPVRR